MSIKTAKEELIYNARISKILALKDNCKKELEETDWYVIRNIETNEPIPSEISEKRTTLRSKCNEKEIELNSLETEDDINNFNINFIKMGYTNIKPKIIVPKIIFSGKKAKYLIISLKTLSFDLNVKYLWAKNATKQAITLDKVFE